MSEATWRAQLYTTIKAVTNVGVVNDYARYANELTDLEARYKTTISGVPQIRGWNIGLESIAAEQIAIRHRGRRTLTFKVRGYMSLDDSAASEKTFSALAETLMNALDDDTTLHEMTSDAGKAQLTVMEHRTFAGVLCHYVEITQRVAEVRTAAA
jgi:hypothetical protein